MSIFTGTNRLHGSLLFLTAYLLGIVTSCSPPVADSSPAKPVTVSQVQGVWRLDYSGRVISDNPNGRGFGIETLKLNSDQTYEQTFNDGRGGIYPTTKGGWQLTTNFQGKPVVTLTNMRYYPNGVDQAVTSPPPPITTLLLETSSSTPFGGKETLILCFDEADLNLCFARTNNVDSK